MPESARYSALQRKEEIPCWNVIYVTFFIAVIVTVVFMAVSLERIHELSLGVCQA